MKLPKARGPEDVLVERFETSGEALLFHRKSSEAHRLSGPATVVWDLCDGETTVVKAKLALAEHGYDPGLLEGILCDLDVRDLVVGAVAVVMGRRRAIITGGVLGFTFIESMLAPPAEACTSGHSPPPGGDCAQCCSGRCVGRMLCHP